MIKPALNLVRTTHLPIYRQLQIEEALLRTDKQNWCLINQGSSPAIVMGISGKPELLIDRETMRKNPLPLIRRFSGGGTVVVDEQTLFITFICNTSTVDIQGSPQKILRWTEELYAPIFDRHPFRLAENDYAIGAKKCGGNAHYLCKDRWLHHTSFLWDYSQDKMSYLSLPPKMPNYREKRSHNEFLCRLKDFLPHPEFIGKRLSGILEEKFKVKYQSLEEIEAYLPLPHRKSTAYVEFNRD